MSDLGICEYCKHRNVEFSEEPCIDCSLGFNRLEIDFSSHDEKVRADAIDEYNIALHTKYEENKHFAYNVCEGDIYKYEAMANLDLEEIDKIAEQLKEKK